MIALLLLALPGCQTTGTNRDGGGQGMQLTEAKEIQPSEADLKLDALKGYDIQKVTAQTRDNAHVIQKITLVKGQGNISEERLIGPYYFGNENSFPANDADLFKKKLEKMGYVLPSGEPTRFEHKRGFGQGFYAHATAKNGVNCFIAFGGYTFGNDLRGLNPNNYQTLVTVNYCAKTPDTSSLVHWLSSLELRT